MTIKRPERTFFTLKALQKLFGVSVNVPSNWLKGVSRPPDGFIEAYQKKDVAAMMDCAEKYKAVRGLAKSDAMNSKGLVRGMSEEQIHREKVEA